MTPPSETNTFFCQFDSVFFLLIPMVAFTGASNTTSRRGGPRPPPRTSGE